MATKLFSVLGMSQRIERARGVLRSLMIRVWASGSSYRRTGAGASARRYGCASGPSSAWPQWLGAASSYTRASSPMCGITGLLDRTTGSAAADLSAIAVEMARTLSRPGPDDQAVWSDRAPGCALGHRRLSILDPSTHRPPPQVPAADESRPA